MRTQLILTRRVRDRDGWVETGRAESSLTWPERGAQPAAGTCTTVGEEPRADTKGTPGTPPPPLAPTSGAGRERGERIKRVIYTQYKDTHTWA